MSRRGKEIGRNDFSGGLHTAVAVTELKENEAYDLSNIVVGPNGDYIRSRYGNTTFNSSAMNSGANVQSLSYYKLIAGTDFLVSVCGNKIFKSELDGVMDDISTPTITAGQNNIWTFLTFNNVHIGFGGPSTAPDAPIQYTGTGNAAALAGTPPSAYGCIQVNNRVFAFRTAANPSLVQWSKLGDGQDWTATGSGSQSISTADNESVTAMVALDNSTVLVFKQNSIHKMNVSTLVSAAFPVYPLFKNVGCIGKHAAVVADGLCYFINAKGKMRITDGNTIVDDKDLPQLSYIDNLWSAMNTSRLEYIQGIRMVGDDYDHIVWLMTSTSSGTTHDTAIIWDIKNKCWLRHKTGFKANVMATTTAGALYSGHYAGIIYKQDVSSSTTDTSESSMNVNSYWASGWDRFGSSQKGKSVQEAYISYVSQTLGNLNFSWGYNFNSAQNNQQIDQRTSGGIIGSGVIGTFIIGGQTDNIKRVIPKGNGQVFQYKFANSDYKMKVNGMNLIVK